jgi:hypothetical protein
VATELFEADLATTTVSSGGTDAPSSGSSETWTVASSAMFGAAATGVSQFHVADAATGKGTEIIAVTNVSGTTWTVTRGAESTTPVTHAAGFTIYQVVTAGWLGTLGPGTGTVTSVTATDTSIVVSGTATVAPTIATGTLDVIAAQHPPAANWSNNSHKITSLANGSGAQDAAAFGQIPSSGTPLALTAGGTGVSESTDAALLTALGAAALAGATFTGWLAPAVVALTDASTVTVNAASGNDFRLTMTSGVGSTRQLGTPSNPVDGQRITVQVTQDSSGSQLLTYTTAYDFGAAGSPTLSTAANAVDVLGFIYNAAKSKWLFAGGAFGF